MNKEDIKNLSDNNELLIKWLDGNIYNMNEKRIKKAKQLLAWCYSNGLEGMLASERTEKIKNASKEFNISENKLKNLYIDSSNFLSSDKSIKTKIIAFEGIDGSGKTVQTKKLEHRLNELNYKTKLLSFPNYSSFFGRKLGSLLSGKKKLNALNIDPKSISLWYALDRAKVFESFDYSDYDFILINRYTMSNIVYQSARATKEERDNLINWIFELEHAQLNLPVPDLYIIFDVNPILSKRNLMQKGKREYIDDRTLDIYEKSENYLEKARKVYLQIAKRFNGIVVIDTEDKKDCKQKNVENIHMEVMKVLNNRNIINTI